MPDAKASLSLVPTPSALEIRIGSAYFDAGNRNIPPNAPISDSTPGVNVARAMLLMRRTASSPDSMSTPDCLYSMSLTACRRSDVVRISELQLVDQGLTDPAGGRIRGRLPVAAPHGRVEAFLLVVFLEHVEAVGNELDRPRTIGRPRKK